MRRPYWMRASDKHGCRHNRSPQPSAGLSVCAIRGLHDAGRNQTTAVIFFHHRVKLRLAEIDCVDPEKKF